MEQKRVWNLAGNFGQRPDELLLGFGITDGLRVGRQLVEYLFRQRSFVILDLVVEPLQFTGSVGVELREILLIDLFLGMLLLRGGQQRLELR